MAKNRTDEHQGATTEGLAEFAEKGAAAQAAVDKLTPPPPPLQVPSLGRIVLYSSAGEKGVPGELHAAVITGVDATTVALHVWTRTAEHNVAAAEQGTTPGTWAWPTRIV